MKWIRTFRLHAAALAVIGCAVLPATASASTTGSCQRDSRISSHYDCQFWPAGNGISGGALVVNSSGDRLGYLNEGTNWVVCQQAGSEDGSSATHNRWWAWTEANDRKVGWVNAIYAKGGANDEPYHGVPNCSGAHGSAPIAGAGTGPAPPPTTPTPVAPSPTQEPCTASGHRYFCTFYPAGDGIHAGAAVVNASGHWVGYLNHGSDWIECQLYGGKVAHGSDYNHYWGWTEANDGKWGWVNAVWASGGSNDGAFAGVPSCDAQRDAAPPGQITSGPRTTKPTRPPKRAPVASHNCTLTPAQENQSANIRFRMFERRERVIEGAPEGTAPPTYDLQKPAYHDFGSISIGAATCHTSRGWQLVSPLRVTVNSVGLYRNADGAPTPRGKSSVKGWGIAVEKVHNGVFYVHALACTTGGSLWDGVHKLLGFPYPVPYYVAVGQYVLDKFLPLGSHRVKCGDLGTDLLRVNADSHGRLRVTSGDTDQNMGGIFQMSNDSAGGEKVLLEHNRFIQPPIITRG